MMLKMLSKSDIGEKKVRLNSYKDESTWLLFEIYLCFNETNLFNNATINERKMSLFHEINTLCT